MSLTAAAQVGVTMPSAAVAPSDGNANGALDRADLALCLSRAFLPPPAGWTVCDWAQPLADDLGELGAALGLDVSAVQQTLAQACAQWALAASASGAAGTSPPDDAADPWLVQYARLFLTPPVGVTLNTGVYLEGGLGGQSAQMMRQCYATVGIEPDAGFRDLPDHVAMQLEFVGRLYERAARGDADAAAMAVEFCESFVHGWAGPLEQACRAAAQRHPAAGVYAELAKLLRHAVDDPDVAR